MLIVKTFPYEGRVKIRCVCGNGYIKSFVKLYPRITWDKPRFLLCDDCGTRELTEKVKYLLGVKELSLSDVLPDGGRAFTGCGTPYVPTENSFYEEYNEDILRLRGRYGSFY
jgi:hypothetical protein